MPEMHDPTTITGIVLKLSGEPRTFDHDSHDFDILREAVIAAGLAETLDSSEVDQTVFAPKDSAFIELIGFGTSHLSENDFVFA